MTEHRFPSISGRPVIYIVETDGMRFWDQAYHSRGAVLGLHFAWAPTFGDGLTQHGATTMVRTADRHLTADYLASLAAFVVDKMSDPTSEGGRGDIACVWPKPPSAERITWALSVRHKDGPTRYFNPTERKVSARDACQHDKRWHKITEHDDGSVDGAMGVLCASDDGTRYRHRWALEAWVTGQAVTEAYRAERGWIPDIWVDPADHGSVSAIEATENLGHAFNLAKAAFRALEERRQVEWMLENFRRQIARRKSETEAA